MSNEPFAGRIRVRVNGLLVRNRSLLLVKLKTKTSPEPIWIPPGGGIEFGETMQDALIREMKEETGLAVKVGNLRYSSEFIRPPWHAIEFYFDVSADNFDIILGNDPELDGDHQLLKDVRFVSFGEFDSYNIVPRYLKKSFVQDYLTGINHPQFIGYQSEIR